jgi:hypothetical protein
MPDVLELLRGSEPSGPYGYCTNNRGEGLEHFPGYAGLAFEDQVTVNEVRERRRPSALLLAGTTLYLFEHQPAGEADAGRRYGYTVRCRPLADLGVLALSPARPEPVVDKPVSRMPPPAPDTPTAGPGDRSASGPARHVHPTEAAGEGPNEPAAARTMVWAVVLLVAAGAAFLAGAATFRPTGEAGQELILARVEKQLAQLSSGALQQSTQEILKQLQALEGRQKDYHTGLQTDLMGLRKDLAAGKSELEALRQGHEAGLKKLNSLEALSASSSKIEAGLAELKNTKPPQVSVYRGLGPRQAADIVKGLRDRLKATAKGQGWLYLTQIDVELNGLEDRLKAPPVETIVGPK